MIRLGLVGIGNCASSLLQALQLARSGALVFKSQIRISQGLEISDIRVVCAFDVNRAKVGYDIAVAATAEPNCTTNYQQLQPLGITVSPGILLDGVAGPLQHVIPIAPGVHEDIDLVAEVLRRHDVDVIALYLPVGAQQASEAYAEAALRSGCGVINCTPAEIACSPTIQERFAGSNLPLIGDDMRSQIGSTVLHQFILDLLARRGVNVLNTYQLNVGGNTDFLNMRDQSRAAAKRMTKHVALRDWVTPEASLSVGPSDFIPHLRDRKVGYIRVEGEGFLGMPFSIELRLEVEDSPNAAAVALDAIRLWAALKQGFPVDEKAALSTLFKRPKS